MNAAIIIQVALPIPKRQVFDYLYEGGMPACGCRVRVSFANRSLIGVVVGQVSESPHFDKLKHIDEVLDTEPVFNPVMLSLCWWLSRYYQHPLGDVMHTALPVALRKGESSEPKAIKYICLSSPLPEDAHQRIGAAKKQRQLFTQLQESDLLHSSAKQRFSQAIINGLVEKQLAQIVEKQPAGDEQWQQNIQLADKPQPNIQQSLAITGIVEQSSSYSTFLLEGVTGSGKTEVYLQAIEPILRQGKQVLILVPEIGLTPQTVQRFRHRFGLPLGVLHSNLTDNERLAVWQQSMQGQLAIIIGTRSAVFTPMKRPGMLIVDEEHDGSYKQQDGLRYNARDLAVVRAKSEDIPLVLGTATPSLESLNNALSKKYQHFELHDRAGNATHTRQNVMDIKNQPLQMGLAKGMLDRIRHHLQQGSQVMLFINRRGFAPALLCHDCGYVEECHRCNTPFTLHKSLNKLQCHHCGSAKGIPRQCHDCGSSDIEPYGIGTEQLENGLVDLFPDYKSLRIDSDSARGKTRLQDLLDKVNSNQYQLLIGTQILSKGHHFPNVTLVVIMDADGALFSADYRAAEHLAQLITQLSGRAGRAEKPGEMWLQTHNPGHPLLQDLVNNGYAHFARHALLERQQASLPPFTYQVLFRAESTDPRQAQRFLSCVSGLLANAPHIQVLGPLPALMEKRQGRFRFQLLCQSVNRASLQSGVATCMLDIEGLPEARKVRWSIDVDPQEFM